MNLFPHIQRHPFLYVGYFLVGVLILVLFTITARYWMVPSIERWSRPSRIQFQNTADSRVRSLVAEYVSNIHSIDCIQFKTQKSFSAVNSKALRDFYLSQILPWTSKEKQVLQQFILTVDSSPALRGAASCLWNTPWTLIKISDRIERAMPFTLGQYIFVSPNFIQRAPQRRVYTMETLLHEKFHTLQRQAPQAFETFYKSILRCHRLPHVRVSNHWRQKHMINPDGLDINWTYRTASGRIILPMLVFSAAPQKAVHGVGIFVDSRGKTTRQSSRRWTHLVPRVRDLPKSISTYHPNEISACMLAKLCIHLVVPQSKLPPPSVMEPYWKLLASVNAATTTTTTKMSM